MDSEGEAEISSNLTDSRVEEISHTRLSSHSHFKTLLVLPKSNTRMDFLLRFSERHITSKRDRSVSVVVLFVLNFLLSGCTLGVSLFELDTDVSYNLTKLELVRDPKIIEAVKAQLVSESSTQTVVSPAYIKVSIWDIKPKPKKDFLPKIKVLGKSEISAVCSVSDVKGVAYCELKSRRTGTYLVTLANATVKSSVEVRFFDGNDSLNVIKESAYANGQDKAIISVIVRTPQGEISPGETPRVQIEGSGQPGYQCFPADSTGYARCEFHNNVMGLIKVKFVWPLIDQTTPLSFVKSHLMAKVPVAKTDVNGAVPASVSDAGAKAVVEVSLPENMDGTAQVGIVPVLKVMPSATSGSVCEASNSLGVATCIVTSSLTGTKKVELSSPSGYAEKVEVLFGDRHSSADLMNPPGTTVPADGKSEQVVTVTIRDENGAIVPGVTPEGTIHGPGTNEMICYPSDANGVAECRITSDTPGDKSVQFTKPAVGEPVELEYVDSNVVIVTDRAPAGEENIITVITKDAEGNIVTDSIPSLEVTGPGQTEYTCTPSNDQGESFCYITADTSGDYHVIVTAPAGSQQSTDIVFTDVKSSVDMIKATALADMLDTAQMELYVRNDQYLPRVGFVPKIKVKSGSGKVIVDCSSTNLTGKSECTIKSDSWGQKILEIENPPIQKNFVVNFLNGFSSLNEAAPGSLVSYADAPGAFAKIQVILKESLSQAIAGFIPKLAFEGSGKLDYDCDPTDENGLAECRISSDTVGEVMVSLQEPLSTATGLKLEFLNKVRACTVDFGHGDQTWTGPGFGDFNSCEHVTCDAGYVWADSMCKEFDSPQNGDFDINGGAIATNQDLVTLNITYPTDATLPLYMLASEDAADNTSWEPLSATKSFTLSSTDAVKTIHMKFKDRFDNISATVSKSIRYDTTAPVGGAFAIANNGNNVVGQPNLDVAVTCPTDISGGVQSAIGEEINPTNWIDCISSINFLLANTSGLHTVYMTFRDQLHNTTVDYTNSVTLDITGPSSTMTYHDGYINTVSPSTGITATAIDDFSAVVNCAIQYQETTVSNGVLNTWGPWQDLARTGNGCGTQSFVGVQGAAYKFRGRAADEWNHVGGYHSPPAILKFDRTPPTGLSITNPTGNQTETSIVLSLDKGSDPESGMSILNADYSIEVRSASNIEGVCQSDWSGWSSVAGVTTATTYTFNGISGKCYHFRYTVTNNAGLTANVSTTIPSRIYYTFSWNIGSWGTCSAAQPVWQVGSWGTCSASQPSWVYGEWSVCKSCSTTSYRSETCPVVWGTQSRSVSCPTTSGTQTRSVTCRRNDGVTVADSYCTGAKATTSQTCSRNDCGTAPASSQSCSRGGGTDCKNRQPTSYYCGDYCVDDGA